MSESSFSGGSCLLPPPWACGWLWPTAGRVPPAAVILAVLLVLRIASFSWSCLPGWPGGAQEVGAWWGIGSLLTVTGNVAFAGQLERECRKAH